MKVSHIVRAIAISLALLATIGFVQSLLVSGNEQMISNSARLIVTCVLAFFLARGASWARWLIIICCLLGIVLGIITVLSIQEFESDHKIGTMAWTVAGLTLNVIIVGLLGFNLRVKEYFSPSTRSSRICLAVVVGGLLIYLGALTYLDFRGIQDPATYATRASYICYGTYVEEDSDGSALKISEIWKQPLNNKSKLTVGMLLDEEPFVLEASNNGPIGAIIFLHQDSNTLKAKLRPFAVLAVYEDRVATTGQTLLEFRRSCGLQKQAQQVGAPNPLPAE